MERRSVELKLRRNFLTGTSALGLRARGFAVPLVAGAAMSLGVALTPEPSMAAATVVCTPDTGIGTGHITGDELCVSGASAYDYIDYGTNGATANGNVTMQGVTIGIGGVSIDANGHAVQLLDTLGNASSINTDGSASFGVGMTGNGGAITINLQATTIRADAFAITTGNTG